MSHNALVDQGRTIPMINSGQYQLRVDRDVWLRSLAGVQRAAHFTVAVPAPGDGENGMASVVKFLREAEAPTATTATATPPPPYARQSSG